MKNTGYKLAAMIISIIAFTAASFGMSEGLYGDGKLNERQTQSLIMGIKSSNEGLCQSSIYFAGKYKVEQSVDVLIEILNDNSRDVYTRILTALSLERIGDERGILSIKSLAEGEKEVKLKFICDIIYNEYYKFTTFQLTADN